ncbi:MAG: TadE/TadG family type IV pilus assembly protein [Pseudomonadota bacterium]
MLREFAKKLLKNNSGNVLVVSAVAAPVIIGFAGLSVDTGHSLYSKSQLQGATEASALAQAENFTASENITIASLTYSRNLTNEIAASILISQQDLPDGHANVAIQSGDFEIGQWDIENEVYTPHQPGMIMNAVRVRGEMSTGRGNQIPTFFGQMFGYSPNIRSDVYAAAPLIPTFHMLNPNAAFTYFRDASSDTDSGDIWVNSNSPIAFYSGDTGGMGSSGIFVKGGATGSLRAKVNQNVFRLPDVLANQVEPRRPSTCVANNYEIDTSSHVTLAPGAYCGGLRITRAGSVTFTPGIYNFLDGPFTVTADTSVRGTDVLLHFDGPGAVLNIRDGDIDFGGRREDEFRGFVIFSSRHSTNGALHVIRDAHAQFAGVVYVPDNILFIDHSIVNGNCHTVCLVSDRLLLLNSTHLNWYPNMYLGNGPLASEPRVTPAVLEPFLRPYLIYPNG